MIAIISITLLALWFMPLKRWENLVLPQPVITVIQAGARHTLTLYAGHLALIQMARLLS